MGTEYDPLFKIPQLVHKFQWLIMASGLGKISDVQNCEILSFPRFFKKPVTGKPIFGAHHTSLWAKSDRISLMWSILNSWQSFEIFEKFIIPVTDMLKIYAHMKTVKKSKILFLLQTLSFRPGPLTHESHMQHAMNLCKNICPKKVPKLPMSSVLK